MTAAEEPSAPQPRRRKRSYRVRGDRLRELRLSLGWSQVEAAERSDLTDRLIRKAESGGPLEPKSISALALAFRAAGIKLEPDELMAEPRAAAEVGSASGTLAERVDRWFAGQWHELNLDVIDELAIPDFTYHAEFGVVRGPDELKARVLEFRKSFSDFHVEVDQITEMGDMMVVNWHVTMVHSGPWLGLEATGRRVLLNAASWVELVGDKFGDAWDFWDPGLIYQQLTEDSYSPNGG